MSTLKNIRQLLLSSGIILSSYASYAQTSVADILKKHKWLTSSSTSAKAIDLNNKGKKSTDLLVQSPSCIWDDILLFKEHGVFVRDDNKNICSSLPKKNGSWNLINKDTVAIKFTAENPPIKFKIVLANEKALVLLANMQLVPGGVDVTYIFISTDQ